mgnify:CR=1 FL=1
MKIDWQIKGKQFGNCNCNYGCPCQFNSLPTDNYCHGIGAFLIEEGFFGDTDLAGVKAVSMMKFPGPIHEGKGKMQITGKLGDVMQESVKAAKSYIRSKSLEYGIIPPVFDKKDFHIHVPEGATPKDGPSAGIGMVTSIISAITEIPVDKKVAMTGEITLRGIILPIGGLKEKLLAAHRAGIKEVIIPKDNEKDLVDIPQKVKDDIKITPIEIVDEVLKIALTKELKRVEWTEVENLSKSKKDESQASIQ